MEMSQAERQVMRVIWAYPGRRSQEIIDLVAADFDWKAATVKTLLNRLKEKGIIKMSKEDGKFHYYHLLSEQEQLQKDGRQVLDNICSTKRGAFLADLIQATPLSQADLASLKEIVQEKLGTAPDQIICDCKPGQCACGHGCH